jgi:hypothetical protein
LPLLQQALTVENINFEKEELMVNSGHDIRQSKDGRFFTCKRCGKVSDSREDRGFREVCAADRYENRIDPTHKMQFKTNTNHPDANDIRKCTKCEKMSLKIDSMFATPCK